MANYIHDTIALRPTDSVQAVLSLFEQYHVSCLPVVEKSALVGILYITDIALCDGEEQIADYVQNQSYPVLSDQTDVLEAIRTMAHLRADCAAVVSKKSEYKGIVYLKDAIAIYSKAITHQPGATISISMHPRNYSLYEIARLVESNDAKILHFFITHPNDTDQDITITLRLNVTYIGKILNAFERFNYQVTGIYNAEESDDDIAAKYKFLIHYLGK